MTRLHRWTPALLVVVLLTMHSEASRAADRIGVAATTKPNADGITAGNSQTLSPGSEVYTDETIRTGNLGAADLVFVDKTDLTVGPTSEVLLDKFVYDATGSKGSVVFQATRGDFRIVTGTQDHRAYAINTPYGSLGDAPADSTPSLDRQARAIFQPPLNEHDVPHGRDGGLMSYAPGSNDNLQGAGGGFGQNDNLRRFGGATVEMVVAAQGQKLRPDECVVKIRLVSGQGQYTSNKGKKVPLTTPNQTICELPNGSITVGSSSVTILAFLSETTIIFSTNTGGTISLGGGTGTITTSPCLTGHCQP
jgi:hypothetical protein